MSLLAAIEPGTVEVEAGGTAEVKVRVQNQSERVDGFRIEVAGPFATWATVEPAVLNLYARAEGEATITFSPPRAPVPRAGPHRFGVKVQSIAEADATIVEEAVVTVRPFIALTSALTRRVERGWRSARHQVTVKNGGNDIAGVIVTAADPEEEVTATVDPSHVAVQPGASATMVATVVRPALSWRGTPRRRPYTIQVADTTGGSESISAIFEQRPIIPGWTSLVVGLVAALVLAIAIGPRIIDWLNDASATAGPSAPATLAPSPSPSPEPSPSPTPEPTPSPTPEPTPTPTIEPTATPTPVPTQVVAPSPEVNFPYFRLTNYTPDDRYVALTQHLAVNGNTVTITLTAKVESTICQVNMDMRATSVPDKYEIGNGFVATFSCISQAPTNAESGELILTKIGAQWSGYFKFHAKSNIHEFDVEGWFINAAP